MSKLIKRLDNLEATALDSLLGFYEPHLPTFCAKAEDLGRKERVCVTSSCYSLLTLTLANSGNVYDHLISFDDDGEVDEGEFMALGNEEGDTGEPVEKRTSSSKNVISIHQVLKTLLATSWRDGDLFQAPLLLYTILKVDRDRSLIRKDPENASKIKSLISSVLKARPHRHYGMQQEHSDYIIYQICKVVALLQESMHSKSRRTLPESALPENVSSEMFWALLRCAEGKGHVVFAWDVIRTLSP